MANFYVQMCDGADFFAPLWHHVFCVFTWSVVWISIRRKRETVEKSRTPFNSMTNTKKHTHTCSLHSPDRQPTCGCTSVRKVVNETVNYDKITVSVLRPYRMFPAIITNGANYRNEWKPCKKKTGTTCVAIETTYVQGNSIAPYKVRMHKISQSRY